MDILGMVGNAGPKQFQQARRASACGMEASGHARRFERLLNELQSELWIGDAAAIRTKRVRKQKTDDELIDAGAVPTCRP